MISDILSYYIPVNYHLGLLLVNHELKLLSSDLSIIMSNAYLNASKVKGRREFATLVMKKEESSMDAPNRNLRGCT